MPRSAPRSSHRDSAIVAQLPVEDLASATDEWLRDSELAGWSPCTLGNRREFLSRFLDHVRGQGSSSCGVGEVKLYLLECKRRGLRPRTLRTYDGHLRTLFAWCVKEGYIESHPMEGVPAPIVRGDQITPLSAEQVARLLAAARSSKYPHRDVALVTLLLDTGVRASELCSLRGCDHDARAHSLTVLGKGNKVRTVYYGQESARALRSYLRREGRGDTVPLFWSEKGGPMTRSGLLQLIGRLGETAGIEGARSSPHTLRHTFAVNVLRTGGNLFSLQTLLGHSDLSMTRRYVVVAEADVERQAWQFSPMDKLKQRG